MNFTIKKMEDWQMVVEAIFPLLQNKILLLKGNLGAGKTTFTQFLLKKMESKDTVTSPTYTIVNEYHSPQGIIYHFDLYRMKSLEEVEDIGMYDYLQSAHLSIIEWPEIYVQELSHHQYHEISIDNQMDERIITFK
jgi:tRNA threonylcarbamoyladenosine biosynthesis protein TsaE